jgi:ABC-type polysaccharide/polyol phosphate export permease
MTHSSTAINPHAAQPTSLVALAKSLWRNRQLIVQMTQREVAGCYKGSVMGLAGSFFNPVFMLAVYTFVFSVVFKARWGVGGEESKTQFAVVLFVGMIVHGLFAEVLNRAPVLILSNVNYVKKVAFPLEVLSFVSMFGTGHAAHLNFAKTAISVRTFCGHGDGEDGRSIGEIRVTYPPPQIEILSIEVKYFFIKNPKCEF